MLDAKGRSEVGSAARGWQLVGWVYLAAGLVSAFLVGREWSWLWAVGVLLTAAIVVAPTFMLSTLMSAMSRGDGD